MKKRIAYLDYVKGVAIFLVVWLHCIQYLFGKTDESLIFTSVVSFHMPLFMIISGYLFYQKMVENASVASVVKRQFCRLIIPTCSFGLISYALRYFQFGKMINFKDILHIPFTYWFLSSLFLSSVSYLRVCNVWGG
jgi:fucose 4-O-acetylase-like acetyltransferase